MKIIFLKNPDINNVEIFIGTKYDNYFNCDINKNIYEKYKNLLGKYNN